MLCFGLPLLNTTLTHGLSLGWRLKAEENTVPVPGRMKFASVNVKIISLPVNLLREVCENSFTLR